MNKKELIISTYHDLVLKRNTSKITVKEICDTCPISRTTFYKYFKDSYDIIEYILLQDTIMPTYDLVRENIDPMSIMNQWYLGFYRHKEFYMIAMKDYGQNSLFDTIISQLTKRNIELYQSEKAYKDSLDLEYYAYRNAATQAMLLKKWMLDGMKVSPSKMAEYFMNKWTHSLKCSLIWTFYPLWVYAKIFTYAIVVNEVKI